MPTFVGVNSGDQVLLDDDTLWRVGTNCGSMVGEWRHGDSISVSEDRSLAFHIQLTNLRTGGCANALPTHQP